VVLRFKGAKKKGGKEKERGRNTLFAIQLGNSNPVEKEGQAKKEREASRSPLSLLVRGQGKGANESPR